MACRAALAAWKSSSRVRHRWPSSAVPVCRVHALAAYVSPAVGERWSQPQFVPNKRWWGSAEICTSTRVEQQDHQESIAPLKRHSLLEPGHVSPRLEVPLHIPRPPYVGSIKPPPYAEQVQIQDLAGIAGMLAAGELAARVLKFAGTLVKPGVTTDEIDKAVHQTIIDAGAYPSPLGYGSFPKSVATSVNECICHGIPDSRPLQDGDIINVDVTVYLNGYHGDTSETFICGMVDSDVKQFVEVTRDCLNTAIAICGPGVYFREIGNIINDIADIHNYNVVEQFVGHGVGCIFHSAPSILHYRNYKPGRMVVGQTFTIEPMLTMGSIQPVRWDDQWTVVTKDGSLSAQFEHTVLITENGAEVLTQSMSIEGEE